MSEKKESAIPITQKIALEVMLAFRENEAFEHDTGVLANTMDRSSFSIIDKTLRSSSLLSRDLFDSFRTGLSLPDDKEVKGLLERGQNRGIGEEDLEKICARLISLHLKQIDPSFETIEQERLSRFKAPKPML